MDSDKLLLDLDCLNSDDNDICNHFHNAYELLYIESGEIDIIIGDSVFTVQPHSLIFINSMIPHSVKVKKKPYLRYYMLFSSAILDKYINSPKILSAFNGKIGITPPCFKLSDEMNDYIKNMIKMIFENGSKNDEFDNLYIACEIEKMLIFLYRENPDFFSFSGSRIQKIVWETRKYIECNCIQDETIEDISQKYFVDIHYFSRAFKNETGFSPAKYRTLCRISLAKELICNSNDSITDIAYKCGFNDVNNFIRSFKKEVGTSPLAFKKLFYPKEKEIAST